MSLCLPLHRFPRLLSSSILLPGTSTFHEQPQEPSYIKLLHKDHARIMNSHLHAHLYSDVRGYKLGRSGGILNRSFCAKLCLLSSTRQPLVSTMAGGGSWLPDPTSGIGPIQFPQFMMSMWKQAPHASTSQRAFSWRGSHTCHVTRARALPSGDHA